MSHSIKRRRRWRTFATTLALTLGSLTVPAAALADGQLDPSFNGTGVHLGTAVFGTADNRIPMVVQADGGIVVGGSRGGLMTLTRFTPGGALDTSWGNGGSVQAGFGGTPSQTTGNSGATAMTLDPAGNIIVGGFGGSASMVAARFTAAGALSNYTVCFAPHLIDYTARGLALRPGGQVVLVGYARDRHASAAVPPTGPAVMYGARAVVTIPPASPTVHGDCGPYVALQGSTNVTIDGLNHDGTGANAALAGRHYEGVATASNANYTLVSTTGPDGAAWVERFQGTGSNGNGVLDLTFNGTGRVLVPAVNLHAIKLGADGSAYAAGESIAAVAADRHMVVARVSAAGGLGNFGIAGIARVRVAGGGNTGQALVIQDGNIIVGGSANLAGRAAMGLARFTAAGVIDSTDATPFGNSGQTTTPIGVPAINGYLTGMALSGNFVAVSGRATVTGGLATIAARYYHTGAPPPPPPLPAAATSSVDQITSNSARVSGAVNANGTAGSWWIEYGTTTGYGAATAPAAIAGTIDDVDVQAVLAGLSAGTVYHARVVISAAGVDHGEDVAFTTLGTPAPAGPATTTGGTTNPTGGTGTTAKKKAKKKQCVVPKVTGKKLNKARTTVFAKGCKVQVKYLKSKKAKNTVLKQSRKAGKKLVFRAVVKLTVATKTAPKKS